MWKYAVHFGTVLWTYTAHGQLMSSAQPFKSLCISCAERDVVPHSRQRSQSILIVLQADCVAAGFELLAALNMQVSILAVLLRECVVFVLICARSLVIRITVFVQLFCSHANGIVQE